MKDDGPKLLDGTVYAGLESKIVADIQRKKRKAASSVSEVTSKKKRNSIKTKMNGQQEPAFNHDRNSTKVTFEENSSTKNRKVLSRNKPQDLNIKGYEQTQGNNLTEEDSNEYANGKTVYIQGLPFSATEEDVRGFFGSCGNIISIRLPKWHDSGRIKGYGHVVFESKASANSALDLSGQYVKDRYVTVDRPMTPKHLQSVPRESNEAAKSAVPSKPVGCRCIFVKNLPYEVTEEEIRQVFMVFGPILTVRLAVWGHTGNLKGFGYIDFKREDSAEIAVRKCSSGSVAVKGRVVTADYETGTPKGSFRGVGSGSADGKKKSKKGRLAGNSENVKEGSGVRKKRERDN